MKKHRALIAIIILVLLTGIAALVHFSTRETVAEGDLQITYGEKEYLVDSKSLEYEQVTGVRVNGKGEEKPVDAPGLLVREILEQNDVLEYEKVTVISDDSYRAELSAEEVAEDGKAYLIFQEEELRLVVFGDENSKRSVSNVVQIVVE